MSLGRHREWRFRVQDILDGISRAQNYVEDMNLDSFRSDQRTIEAIERIFILIGEATNGIPDHIKAQFPVIPWRDIRDMRNFVVHHYWGVDADRLWDTMKTDLPFLAQALKKVLEEAQDTGT